MGAAVQAALRARDQAVDDLVVTDVAPFSLGIAAVTRFGGSHVEGLFEPIIERGTVIPVSRSKHCYTVQDNQRRIEVEVYQGEHPHCRDNVKLGSYEVDGLPAKPAGEAEIEVRFTYDLNGILEVESSIVGTNKSKTLVIEQRPGTLNRQQLTAAREAMQRLKFHPRDALPNQTALARADALYVELTGVPRAELGAAIAELQGALETQDPALIAPVREKLVRSCASCPTTFTLLGAVVWMQLCMTHLTSRVGVGVHPFAASDFQLPPSKRDVRSRRC